MQKYLIVITGPTGIGKTAVTIRLAKHFDTEIISADSRQLFRELYIGTATPNPLELSEVKHHLIQSHSITDNYNASRYEIEVLQLMEKLFRKTNLLFLTGGSMLYIDAVCNGIDKMPDADPEIRLNLKSKLEKEGIENLRLQLKQLDPDYYKNVDLKNPNRIIHALEITLTTGKPYSSFRTNPKKQRPFTIIKIGLDCDRQILHKQINTRVDKMIEEGLETEAQKLYANRNLNALNTVGYREFFDYIEGKISRDTAIELIKRNSRRYARKQLTWFRNDLEIRWFQPEHIAEIIKYIEQKTGLNND